MRTLRPEQSQARRRLAHESAPGFWWHVRDLVGLIVRPFTRIVVWTAYGAAYAVCWIYYQLPFTTLPELSPSTIP